MDLPPEAIQEFKEIYLKEFGEKLSEAEAQKKATALFNLLWMLCRRRKKKPAQKSKGVILTGIPRLLLSIESPKRALDKILTYIIR